MFTAQTQIPTLVRLQVRALVKGHPAWESYKAAKGLVSAAARNADILDFALQHPALAAQVDAMLTGPQPSNLVQARLDAASIEEAAAQVADDTSATRPSEALLKAAGMYEVEAVLAGVEQFLSPLVKGELAKALAPVLEAANRGPVEKIVEVERIVEVEAGSAPRVVTAKARRDKTTTFRTLYPSKARDAWRDKPLTLWTGAPCPVSDPFYVVDHAQMALLMTAIERGSNVWLTGPAGTGKSTMPEEAAAALGRPFVHLGLTRQTEVAELVGGWALRNGSTVWEDGALIKAMRQPGTIILVDEITFPPAGVQAIFQQVTSEHRSYTLPTGERVKCADGVVFVAADNTTGSGDEGGMYAGTNVSNGALVTRFKRMIHVDYLSQQQEAEALVNHTKVPMPAAKHLAAFIANARRLPALSGVVLSMRQMVGFVQTVQDGFSVKDAFAVAISSRMPATERATIDALATLQWANEFEALVNGTTAPAAPVAPSTSAASQAFADNQY